MKRVFFLSSAIVIVLSAFSQQVTRQEAVNAAVNTMKYNGRTSLAKSSIISIQSKNNGDTVLIYEVLFQSGEIVLLSGNKACLPVLGYSLPTSVSAPQSILENYADIPDGLRDMLSEYEEQILFCFRNNMTSSHYNEWQDLQHFESGRTITTDVVPPLLTTEWGQSYSNDWWDCNTYNYYVSATHDSCDCDIHQKCPAGCVATSMAQIMKYWNYPVWIPNKVEQYDWCNMPDELIYFGNPYANVPKTFTRLTSVPNDPQYPATWRTIPAGAISEYVVHEEVLLQDGFLAEAGSDFYAHIVPCGSCEEGRTTGEMSDVIGGGNDNPADTFPVPKSLQTEVSPADETALTVYPNPTDDLLFVELRGAGIANVALYDLQGRAVETLRATSLQDGTATLDVKSLPAGVYVLRVKDADGREYQQKVVRR